MRAPFFLVGCPRSGTTLLQQMLDAHPLVAVAPETFFIRRQWGARSQYGDLADDARLGHWLDDFVSSDEFADTGLDASAFRRAAAASSREWPALFGLLLDEFRSQRGAECVGEKTPNHLFAMRQLEAWFPGARFVHVVRDPRAVTLSWREVPWTTRLLVGDADVWRQYQAAARRAPPRDAAGLATLRYEALVADPEGELRRLCDFLHLDFDPGMLRYHERGVSGVDLDREPWKRGAGKPVSEAAAVRWRDALSRSEIRDIEAVCWGEMLRAGYAPQFAPASLALAWPRVRIAIQTHRLRGSWRRAQGAKRRRRAAARRGGTRS